MPNRYTRDELISIALDMVQLPNLQQHDMPAGVVQPDAFCIQWLQDILDFWYHMMPFSATVDEVAITCVANTDSITLPSDFILDVRNGYLVQTVAGDTKSLRRVFRMPLQKFINRQLQSQRTTSVQYPRFYCIVGDDENIKTQYQTMRVTPMPTITVLGKLWYYKLPPVLYSEQKPKFPNDYVCIEYLRIRALEWNRILEPGTAQRFCEKVVAGMKAAGLMNEPEDDEIPMDELTFRKGGYDSVYMNSYGWMGAL
jgi:hypothetical protein